ncbi:HEPN domain-containing protein [Burkholderia ubonensis]|uniref:HEPN domain-containing protein n=1 Tax=Burkholderia ubonensis TaxID=101571 RepID=UPI0012FAEB13|nr:HEPN domain-containing protein [Burkholderia ubonensis]
MTKKILEERGLFWWHEDPVPANQFAPDSCVVGTLSIEENGATYLELDGYFANSEGGPMAGIAAQGQQFPLEKAIQGKLKASGRNVLLLGLRRRGGRFSSNGISHEGFAASHCLVTDRAFPPAKRPLRFNALDVELTGLEEWLRLGNIEVKRTRQRISAKHRAPRADIHELDDGTLTMRYDITGPRPSKFAHRMDKLNLVESVNLCVKLKRARTLLEMRDEYARLQELFILLTGTTFSLEWPRLIIGKMAYHYYYEGFERSTKAPTWDECWINYIQVKSNFGSIVTALRRKREEFGPGFYLYLGIRRGMKMYVEHRFVNLIWGLESLHRRKNKDKAKESKLDAKIQRILAQISGSDDKRWLKGQLKHSGEPSLKERLMDVLSALPLDFERKRMEAFCKSCADRRNDMSHFGGQREGSDYREFMIDLVRKSEALACLYHAVLLHEIGVDATLIKAALLENGPNASRSKYAFREVGLLPVGKGDDHLLDG